MGQTLDTPKTEKECVSGKYQEMAFAACGMQGWRIDMEDAHTNLFNVKYNNEEFAVFGVFDGHAGTYTSKICSSEMPKHITNSLKNSSIVQLNGLKNEDEKTELTKSLQDAFVSFDDMLKASDAYSSGKEVCGTTALVAIVTDTYVIFCNCGDSRGFLSKAGNVCFETLDHKPSNPIEKTRIERSGGSVVLDRVNGNLAVSRAIGDFSFKDKDLPTIEQAVSPEPTVTIIERKDSEFMLLACDGIWDVMSTNDVRDFVHSKLKCGINLVNICKDLIMYCLMKESRDNMSALLLTFEGAPKADEEEVTKNLEFEKEIVRNITEIIEGSDNASLTNVLSALLKIEFVDFSNSHVNTFGVLSKVNFIEEKLDELLPSRDRSRDFNSASTLSSFPMALEALQQFVKPKSYNDGNQMYFETISNYQKENDIDQEDSNDNLNTDNSK